MSAFEFCRKYLVVEENLRLVRGQIDVHRRGRNGDLKHEDGVVVLRRLVRILRGVVLTK